MNKPPTCCGKLAKQFLKRYCTQGIIYSIAIGFTCLKCGHVGVPFLPEWKGIPYYDTPEQKAIYEEGLAFDSTLTKIKTI